LKRGQTGVNIYIALFRGINIGGHHLLPMNGLVGILKSIGCERIRTYIQSGNVVFCSKKKATKKIAEAISTKILEKYGFKPNVLLLGVSGLKDAIENNPYKDADGKALHFLFLESTPKKPDLEGLRTIKSKSEEFRLSKKVFYLYAPDGVGRSKLVAKVEKSLGVPVTGRNWNTVCNLLAIVNDGQGYEGVGNMP
jgi:uncharacterized protein (DUF1697 family)